MKRTIKETILANCEGKSKEQVINQFNLKRINTMTNETVITVSNMEDQPQIVLVEYIHYVDSKTDMEELPLSFGQWADIEVEENSPISKLLKMDV